MSQVTKSKVKKIALFLPFLVFALLAGIFFSQIGKDTQYMPSALIGKPVPDFSLVDLATNKVVTQKELGQQGYLINFWGTWCPACSYEHDYLMQLASEGIDIVGIDYKDDTNEAIKWLQEKGDPYSIVLLDELGNFGVDMGVTGAPETFVVNTKGKITYRHQGIVNEEVWQIMKEYLR